MPLHWIIDSKERLVTLSAEGDITRVEIEACIAVMTGAGTLSYRKLFDGTRGNTAMTSQDILTVGVRLRALHAESKMPGALALVLSPDKSELVSRMLGILAVADRPMRVFSDIEPARRWIGSLPK